MEFFTSKKNTGVQTMNLQHQIVFPYWKNVTFETSKDFLPLKISTDCSGTAEISIADDGSCELLVKNVSSAIILIVNVTAGCRGSSTPVEKITVIGDGFQSTTGRLSCKHPDVRIIVNIVAVLSIPKMILHGNGLECKIFPDHICDNCKVIEDFQELAENGIQHPRFVFPEKTIVFPLSWFAPNRISLFRHNKLFQETGIVQNSQFSLVAIENLKKAVSNCEVCEYGHFCLLDDDVTEETISAAHFYYLETAIRTILAKSPVYKAVFWLSQLPLREDCRFDDLRSLCVRNYFPERKELIELPYSGDSLFLLFAKALNKQFVEERLLKRAPPLNISGEKRSSGEIDVAESPPLPPEKKPKKTMVDSDMHE